MTSKILILSLAFAAITLVSCASNPPVPETCGTSENYEGCSM